MRHRTYPATAVIRRADGRREQCLAVTATASIDDDGSEVVTYDPPIVLAAGDSVTITPTPPSVTVNDKTEEQSMEREEVIEHLREFGEREVGYPWNSRDVRTASAAAVGLLESRWSGFSEEELCELRAGALYRHEGIKAVPAEYRERAGRLASELRKEIRRREAERVSYRGPGIYRHVGGEEYEVLGKTPASAELEQVVLHRITDAPGDLLAESLAEFNSQVVGADWGRTPADVVHAPRYTWVREA